MNLLMISGDRNLAIGKPGAFLQTLEGLSKEFARIDIICPRVSNQTVFELLGNVYLHPSPWHLLWQPQWIKKKGRSLIAEHQHSVMTVQDYPPFYNGFGALELHKKTGIPFCQEIHHIVGWPKAANFTEWIGRILSKDFLPHIAKHAAAVRVVNRTAGDLLTSWGVSRDQIHIVPSFYLDASSLIPSSEAPTIDVAFCGRLVANKGLFNFLKAMALLPEKTAVVIGDGPLRSKAEAFTKGHGLQDRVRFTGWLPAGGQIAEIKKSKTLVMCSLSEGGPRVVLEAMACGVPVVATPVGIVPEVINGQNGLLTTGEPADIAAKLQSILSDDTKRKSMGEMAHSSVLPRFDSNTTLPAYAHFLQSLAR